VEHWEHLHYEEKTQRFKCYLSKPDAYKEDPHWFSVTGSLLGRVHKILGQGVVFMEIKGLWSDRSFVVMIVLVHKVGGTGGEVGYMGWPGGIVSVLRESEDASGGSRKQGCDLYAVPLKFSIAAQCLWHWGARGYAHGQCLPARGQQ